ncbi:hypothetical protein Q6A88_07765 [Aliarcobacter skirrowii]|uniref:hypothetical protein n=1 Tax=Aliarcobacter skirrowii TaxID=28200 RepID=UPI0029A410C1|nr:hypothetical protein [Aliarcobacter skirrowii]MDX4071597.1 hypothetical protein [Aliarcobacter skirrowii]
MDFSIENISKDRKCWVVRCEGGEYFNHFVTHKQMAIGHIDFMGYSQISDFIKNENVNEEIINFIMKSKAITYEAAKKIASPSVSQAKRFIKVIAENDYVITVGASSILVGRVKGDAFFDKTPLICMKKVQEKIVNGKPIYKEIEHKMDLTLRRKVEWIANIPKKKAPFALQKLLISPLAVFSMKDPLILFHSIYPIFLYNKKYLHFSIFIKQETDIKNNDMINLLQLLNDIENESSKKEIIKDINNSSSIEDDKSNINIKASFMSPGELFGFLTVSAGFDLGAFCLIYTALFGNKYLGVSGIIPEKARVKIVEHILNNRKKSVDKLNLTAPDYINSNVSNTNPIVININIENFNVGVLGNVNADNVSLGKNSKNKLVKNNINTKIDELIKEIKKSNLKKKKDIIKDLEDSKNNSEKTKKVLSQLLTKGSEISSIASYINDLLELLQ